MTEIQRLDPAPVPARIGQGTAVEQSRAVAEVAAAVQVAQACPRDVTTSAGEMRRSCAQSRLAERAFFRYNRGDGTVTGASVYLARELARCWGNVQYGLVELRRDDEHGQSEMQAWAWDVQTNTRASTTFIVPHARDVKGGRKPLEALRDVYENNANNGARRLREQILALLPQWFVEEAKDLCLETVKSGNGKPIEQRVADALRGFEGLGITRDQVEKRIGFPCSSWTAQDLASLTVIFRSLQRGEIRAEDEFEPARLTLADVTHQAPAQPSAEQSTPAPAAAQHEAAGGPAAPAATAPGVERYVLPVSKGQLDAMRDRFEELGIGGRSAAARAGRMRVLSEITDRKITDPRELNNDEGRTVLDNLAGESGQRIVDTVLGTSTQEPAEPQPPDDPAESYDPTTESGWARDEAGQ